MFRITIEEFVDVGQLAGTGEPPIQRYQQTVDVINMRAVMNAVNSAPRKSRAKARSPMERLSGTAP